MATQQTIDYRWQDQAIWSQTANRLKAELSRWRGVAAIAGVLGALLETLAATLSALDERWWWLSASIAIAGAAVLSVVPIVLRTKVSKDQVERWVSARSTSEALKAMIYRFLAGAHPFSAESVSTELVQRCQAIVTKAEHLGLEQALTKPPKKKGPLSLTAAEYLQQRVSGQIEYYQDHARENALAARRLRSLEFGLGLLGAAMGAAAGCAAAAKFQEMSYLGAWVAVVTTLGAAVTSHLVASGYEHQATAYQATASRLKSLQEMWGEAKPERPYLGGFSQFVDDCENVIATQNESWIAEWKHEKGKVAAA